MSEHTSNILARLLRVDQELLASPEAEASGPRTTHDYVMFEELSFVRREAQAEANLAYEAWRSDVSSDAYAAYRAAQDRADVAQDQLAECWRRIA